MRCARRGVKRAVLDPGVLVCARGGSFELIVPPLLLGELRLVLQRKMLRRYVDPESVGYPVLHSGRAPRGPRLNRDVRRLTSRFAMPGIHGPKSPVYAPVSTDAPPWSPIPHGLCRIRRFHAFARVTGSSGVSPHAHRGSDWLFSTAWGGVALPPAFRWCSPALKGRRRSMALQSQI